MSRGERGVLGGIVVLMVWTVVPHWQGLRTPAIFVPLGLAALALINSRLRAKGLAWGILTLATVLGFLVGGAWVMSDRTTLSSAGQEFFRTTALYISLFVAALFQVRVNSRGVKGDSLV